MLAIIKRPRWSLVLAIASPLLAALGLILVGGGSPSPQKSALAADTAPGSAHDERVDPVEHNGPIFQGWDKPRCTLIFSGDIEGYIEPCGCAGLENQKGGLSRRDTFLKQIAKDGWNPVPMDVGQLVLRYGEQNKIKYFQTVDAMKSMGYQAIGFGPADLRLPESDLIAATSAVKGKPSPFISANVGLIEFSDDILPRWKVVNAGGVKIGVTSILGADELTKIANASIVHLPVEKALTDVLGQLKKQKCDLLVLLSYASPKESAELAKKFQDFDFIVTANGAAEPPAEPIVVEGTPTRLVEVGHKGMFLAAVGVYDAAKKNFKYQRVPLDSRFADSDAMARVMTSYQLQLQQLGLRGLGVTPQPSPSGRTFVGSAACADCHDKAYKIWKASPHAKATDTLVHLAEQKKDPRPARQYDPECLSCHVTGWDPQKFVPYKSGYLSLRETPKLAQNGCENCHGPGSEHVAVESGDKKVADKERRLLRESMHVADKKKSDWKKVAAQNCELCHDHDNSPKFDFDSYWKKIEH